jgi:hypothetical protein
MELCATAALVRTAGSLAMALALVGALGACAGEQSRPAAEAMARPLALTGATAISSASGLVRITGAARVCTGALLTQRWAITRASCFCEDDLATPAAVVVEQDTLTTTASAITVHPSEDLALVRLNALLPLATPQALWPEPPAALAGKIARCYGYATAPAVFEGAVESSDAVFPAVASGCGMGRAQRGFTVASPGIGFEPGDAGGPCFVSGAQGPQLAGIMSEADGGARVRVLSVGPVLGWIASNTDIWSAARCGSGGDVPHTRFALEPVIFTGSPNPGTLTVVALRGSRGGGSVLTHELLLRQSSSARLDTWTEVTLDNFSAPFVRWLSASSDPRGVAGSPLVQIAFLPSQGGQRAFSYDRAAGQPWLMRDDPRLGSALRNYDGEGLAYSSATPRVTVDMAEGWPLFVTGDGRVGTSAFVETAPDGSAVEGAWRDMFAPSDAPPADPLRRPSLVAGAGGELLAGYRTPEGELVSYRLHASCRSAAHDSVFCAESLIRWPLPSSLRHVALGRTAEPGERYFALGVEGDGSLRLWRIDLGERTVSALGMLPGRALSTPKLAAFRPAGGHEELFVGYVADDWSARVLPAANCLGNTPPGF